MDSKYYDNWTQTHSGKQFFLFHPEFDSIDIDDIAHSLSMQCRFNGHTKTFYSVAEHSYWASHIVSPENALTALMHDAGEAYISDIPKPFKLALGDEVQDMEDLILDVIAEKYGFETPLPSEVKRADLEMLLWEKKHMMRQTEHRWGYEDIPLQLIGHPFTPELEGWDQATAKAKFLERFNELTSV